MKAKKTKKEVKPIVVNSEKVAEVVKPVVENKAVMVKILWAGEITEVPADKVKFFVKRYNAVVVEE